jgi:hypothetical protein
MPWPAIAKVHHWVGKRKAILSVVGPARMPVELRALKGQEDAAPICQSGTGSLRCKPSKKRQLGIGIYSSTV